MPADPAALAEAYRRGLLDDQPQMKAAVEEGMKRGVIPNPQREDPTGDVLKDIIRSAPKAAARGLTSAARFLTGGIDPESAADIGPSRPESAAKPVMEAAAANREAVNKRFEKAIEKLPEARTTPGKFTSTAIEYMTDPTSYIGPGGVVRKGLQAAASGLGAEAAGELTDETPGARTIGGMLPTGLVRPPRPVLKTDPQRLAQVATLRKAGVEPSAGDVTGRRWLKHGEEMGDYLGGGKSYTAARTAIGEDFTNVVARAMGENVQRITPDVLESAKKRIGSMFDQAHSNMHINIDQQLVADGVRLRRDLTAEALPAETEKRIVARINDIYNAFTQGRGMSGRTYLSLTSDGTPLQRAIHDPDPNVAYFSERIRNILDKAALRSAQRSPPGSPARKAVPLLKQARSQWFNYLVARDATTKAGAAAQEGLITPQNLRQELTRGDRKLRYALNRSVLAPISRAGNIILPAERSSGTTERLSAQRLHQIPQGIAGRIINAPAVQRYLMDQGQRGPIPPRTGRMLATGVTNEAGREDPLQPEDDALAPGQ